MVRKYIEFGKKSSPLPTLNTSFWVKTQGTETMPGKPFSLGKPSAFLIGQQIGELNYYSYEDSAVFNAQEQYITNTEIMNNVDTTSGAIMFSGNSSRTIAQEFWA
ncbi:MAG: hypothetical protein V7776_06750 [Halopseudomonas aestusnigri]